MLRESYIAKAPADGHFIAIGSSTSLAVAPNTRLKLEYDARRDFAPLSILCEVPQWIVATPTLPAATLGGLVALVKSQPGKFSYASYGQGTLSHLGMELCKSIAGVEMLHVPYKGGPQAHPDVISGRVPVLWDSVSSALSSVRSGKLKALAVTGAERLADVRARMSAGGLLPRGSGAEEARARINSYMEKFALAVKISGYQPE